MLHQEFLRPSECGYGEMRVFESVISEERKRIRNNTLLTNGHLKVIGNTSAVQCAKQFCVYVHGV
jgi:hypothetical protein